MGKGCTRRPELIKGSYEKEYDRIFGKKPKKKQETKPKDLALTSDDTALD